MTTAFDWAAPDYTRVYQARADHLALIRQQPHLLPELRGYYAEHPAEFISHFGLTSDPRNKSKGLSIELPFLLFPRQVEMLEFIAERMRRREPGLIEKSRDCGASWLAMCFAATLCLFNRNVVVGVGSSKEDKVDRSGDPDSLLWKARFFLQHLPPEFRGGWDESRHSAHMRISFPDTGSVIVGEAGDGIGRGGRSTLYFIDEAAFLERPQLIEASLASNTECRIDISTPHGRANSFAVKRHSGKVPVFTFQWRHDPRKDERWYARQVELLDPVTRAQEIDLSYDASVEGILIPAEWVHAAIGAHAKLGIEVTGSRRASLDVADEGRDKCAFVGRHGILLQHAKLWSGKNSDIYRTVAKTIALCDAHGYDAFDYDADGLGAGVRGDAVDINIKRREVGKREIEAVPFRGSGAVCDPDGSMVEGRLNKDYFANAKAQAWWSLRLRFQYTWRAVTEGMPYHPDAIISIDPELPELTALVTELSQPTYSVNTVGKIVVDKTPDGAASPNLGDAVMIAYAPRAGAYFAAAPARDIEVAAPAKVVAMPKAMDYAFAALAFSEDTAAVVFCAANRPDTDGTRGPGFYLCDWDLRALDVGTEAWMWSVSKRLEDLYKEVGAKMRTKMRVYCDNFDSGYAELMRQRGFPAVPIGDDLPPVAERFDRARPYANVGLVLIADRAQQRVVTVRDSTRNFLRELLSQPQVAQTNALALAYATAILIVYKGRAAVPPPTPIDPKDWSPHDFSAGKPPAPAPPPPRVPRDPNLPKPRSYLAAHGTLPPGPHSKRGGIKVG